MVKFLERVDGHYGSMDGYVTEFGVDADTVERLRSTIIE
jgi:protein tyrosine/serine phosphatase